MKKVMTNNMSTNKSGLVQDLNVTIDDTTAHLVHLGLRKNKKRAHLLVSNILGKHIPINPYFTALSGAVLGAKVWNSRQRLLSHKVNEILINEASEVLFADTRAGEWHSSAPSLVTRIEDELAQLMSTGGEVVRFATVGFAETATGLGANVARALGSEYHHSTRDWAGRELFLTFEEEHSHATSHALVDVRDGSAVTNGSAPLVLVDDEFSTGKTLMNIIKELHELVPERKEYYVVSLIDCRNSTRRVEMDDLADDLGVAIRSVTISNGEVGLPDGILDTVVGMTSDPLTMLSDDATMYTVNKLDYPSALTRLELLDNQPVSSDKLIADAETISETHLLDGNDFINTLVLGREEFMYYPQSLAQHLGHHFSSTTRSPIMVFDREDYPVRNGVAFVMDDGSYRYAYNVGGFENVILVQDNNLSNDEAIRIVNTLQLLVPNVVLLKPEHASK